MDREYWHIPEARSWHAQVPAMRALSLQSMCGREAWDSPLVERSDRLPPTAHLCGNCSRIIAARTDIEAPFDPTGIPESELLWMGDTPIGRVPDRVSDVPEPVASEQRDVHVFPVEEWGRPHVLEGTDCWCNPRVETVPPDRVFDIPEPVASEQDDSGVAPV